MKDVLYSHALDAEGNRRSITETEAPRPFRCGDCAGEMIAKRGRKNRWHYAHKVQVVCVPRPDPDNALHRYAQDRIFESFNRHQAEGTQYPVGVRCASVPCDFTEYEDGIASCDEAVVKNAARPDARIHRERELVADTRSDLTIEFENDDKAIILEVVNTHPLEKETRDLYRHSGHPVLTKKISWESLDTLGSEFVADESINLPPVRCKSCKGMYARLKREEQERRETLQRGKSIVDKALKRLVRRPSATPKFQPWYQTFKSSWTLRSSPIPMYPKVQAAVFANAIILTEMGFVQHNSDKPHLFSFQIMPRTYLYADLGGSDVMPIYEDTAAMLYILPALREDAELDQYAIDRFGCALQEAGVNVRTGFESTSHIEQKDINPTRHVSRTMLDGLTRWLNTCRRCHSMSIYRGRCQQCGSGQGNSPESKVSDDTAEIMSDFPGRPVKSPRK